MFNHQTHTNKMKKKIILFFLLISLIITNSCNSPTENQQQFKHPRDMIWTIDTLSYPGSDQTIMTSMWASSSRDVWIAGHNDRSKGNLWHFNGNKWSDYVLSNDIERSPLSFAKIYGLANNNVWVVGDREFTQGIDPSNRIFSDLIIQYNGKKWTEHKQNSPFRILSLFCNTPNDIWVGGDNGFIANYDGIKWKKDTIVIIKKFPDNKYFINSLVKINEQINVSIYQYGGQSEIRYFIKGNLNNWRVVDSIDYGAKDKSIKWGYWGFDVSPLKKLLSYGYEGIWEWDGKNWNHLLKIRYPVYGLFALNDNYIIAPGDFGIVYFFDGTNWEQLTMFSQTQSYLVYTDAWTNGYEAFILGHTIDGWPQKTVIWRGK